MPKALHLQQHCLTDQLGGTLTQATEMRLLRQAFGVLSTTLNAGARGEQVS